MMLSCVQNVLQEFSKKQTNLDTVQGELWVRFEKYFQIWKKEGFETIRQLWLEDAANLGKIITVLNGKTELVGKFIDLDAHGHLIIQSQSGDITRVLAGDINFSPLESI